ncbi:hypothetical protein FXN61_36020 [Lentzea sp. PSKA42]|uniref:Acyl carrier protein n=1 Tax=Lentzea indica TaxID=2604800 RepID=A0ABX1FSB3_9PSEU|nr:hypothetical protein [Lentzea indica]NKE61877.1 hypothetical protein [Lentzea indica]
MSSLSSPAHVLLSLLSARTGRPAATLTPELELTADLHLGSLARVELLIALRTRLPGLPAITVTEACGFRTLGELQAALEGEHLREPVPAPRDFSVEVTTAESRSPLAWMIECFVAASGATTLRDVSLLRDPGTGTGPITVRGQGKLLALVSNVLHGRARIAEPSAPHEPAAPKIVTVRGPHALDECFREAADWAHDEFGGTATAKNVREVRVHRTGLLSTPGKVAISAGRVRDGRAECDVLLMDADGSARIGLRGVLLLRHPR